MTQQLKMIKGSYYKDYEIIMLPSNNKSSIGINRKQDNLYYFDPVVSGEGQHLYILSDELPKVGEIAWLHWGSDIQHIISDYRIGKVIKIKDGYIHMTNQFNNESECNIERYKFAKWGKIIATTDNELTYDGFSTQGDEETYIQEELPNISKEFLETYVKAQGKINKILVEYERFFIEQYSGIPPRKCKISSPDDYKIKISSNNTIFIKEIEDKSYSREEVEKILSHYRLFGPKDNSPKSHYDWIKENL